MGELWCTFHLYGVILLLMAYMCVYMYLYTCTCNVYVNTIDMDIHVHVHVYRCEPRHVCIYICIVYARYYFSSKPMYTCTSAKCVLFRLVSYIST